MTDAWIENVAKTVTGIIPPYSYIRKYAAYNPIERLNIIKTELDMIHFIEKMKLLFSSPEDYKKYYVFNPQWNENTGKNIRDSKRILQQRQQIWKHSNGVPKCDLF